jgi:chromosome segregation ATPase
MLSQLKKQYIEEKENYLKELEEKDLQIKKLESEKSSNLKELEKKEESEKELRKELEDFEKYYQIQKTNFPDCIVYVE